MKKLTPLKAIRKYCLECCREQPKEVRLCTCEDCPLHKYRFGTNPDRSKSSEDQYGENESSTAENETIENEP